NAIRKGGMMQTTFARIHSALQDLINDHCQQWLHASIENINSSKDVINELMIHSAGARRILGETRLPLGAEVTVATEKGLVSIEHWTAADLGRALLILQAITSAPELERLIVLTYFEQGDESEVASVVRVVNLLNGAERFKFQVREVGRTNSKPLYAALAQYNPYPARFYDVHEFNQLVLKALFMGIGIDSVIGLDKRANSALSKMCEDYIDERLAAGRSLPFDIWLAVEPFASEKGLDLIRQYSRHETPEHRYFAVKALQQQNPLNAERTQWLKELLEIENDDRILTLLSSD
ncbi:MAG: EboA domain-containing protein, partial [Gammaproteobacteria bacterium]